MCYDIKVSLERQLKVARHYGDAKVIDEITKKLLPLLNPIEREYFQVSGFTHPKAFVVAKDDVKYASWGLIPDWTQDKEKAKEIANKTLNARVESIYDKPSFRKASVDQRCILFVDGFYEHKHINKKTYPYFIQRRDRELMAIAAIYDNWSDPLSDEVETTFSIVTTKANELMTDIHNSPKLPESRMPLILDNKGIDIWLNGEVTSDDHDELDAISGPCSDELLDAHTVRRFKGKSGVANAGHADEEFHYPELGPTLFD
jgi:putative SOS response-associated peptidase YedK